MFILAQVNLYSNDLLCVLGEDIHKILEDNNLLPPVDDSTCSRLEAESERDWVDAERSDDELEGDDVKD